MEYVMPSLLADYRCSQCGRCCYGWNIEADQAEFKEIILAIRKIPVEERPQPYGFDLKKTDHGKIESGYLHMRDNHCCFLQQDHRCFLHAHWGQGIKPNICISYPFYAVKTPRVIYVNSTFSCLAATKFLCKEPVYAAVWPSDQIGSRFSLKMDVASHTWVRIAPEKVIDWDSFYRFQNFMTTSNVSRAAFVAWFWHQIKECAEQNISQEKLTQILETPVINPEIKSEHIISHLQQLFQILELWEQRVQSDPELIFSIGLLKKRLGYTDKVTPEMATQYQSYITECKILSHELQEILQNYLYVHLFMTDHYFSRSLLEAMGIFSTAVALVTLIAIANIGTDTGITTDLLIDSIIEVEKYFFHSDIFSHVQTDTLDPLIFLAPFLANPSAAQANAQVLQAS